LKGSRRDCRRVCPDFGEIQVQRDQDPALAWSLERYRRILRSCQPFIGNRVGLEPLAAQYPGAPIRQVLINFQFQTVCSKGRSAVPSRASAAA